IAPWRRKPAGTGRCSTASAASIPVARHRSTPESMISRPHAGRRWRGLRLTTVAVEAAPMVLGDGEGLQPGIVAIWVVDETDRRHVWFDHVDLLQGRYDQELQPEPGKQTERVAGRHLRT